MVDYNEKIAKKANLEFIMVSLDDQESSAVKWAKKEDFPWPTLLLPQYTKEKKNLGLIDSLGEAVPDYALLDKNGKIIARGKDQVYKLAGIK